MPASPPLLFRLLMRLYPRAYRARYAVEMAACFERDRRAAGGGLSFWLGAVADHMVAAWRVRFRRAADERGGVMNGMGSDVRAAWKALRRAPAFAVFASVTLALGIGATTSVYTVLDRVVLRPLPFAGADRMVRVGSELRHAPGGINTLSPALHAALAEAPGPAEALAAVGSRRHILSGRGDPEWVVVQRVDEGFLGMFEATAAVGRLLLDADQEPGAPMVAVLAHGLWTDRFGADPGVVGSEILLDGQAYTVVGVVGAGFSPPSEAGGSGQIWAPFRFRDGTPDRSSFYIRTVALLRPGASIADLQTHMARIVSDVYPPDDGPSFVTGAAVRDLRTLEVGDIGRTLGRVLAAVVLLLLISCLNVASLLLTRGAERARELSVRAALGASRLRLVRQLLVESALLAGTGAALGAGLSVGALALFRRYAPAGIPRLAEATLDVRVLAVTFGCAGLTVLAFGLAPAVRAARRSAGGSAILARGSTQGVRERRVRGMLVAAETALAVMLVVGSGLLAHDLMRVAGEDRGFDGDGLLTMGVNLYGRPAAEDNGSIRLFWEQLLAEAEALPGVRAATLTTQVPYRGSSISQIMMPERHTDADEGFLISSVVLGGDYLATLGTSLVEGRMFSDDERATAAQVALVNEAFVRQYWPGETGPGLRIKSGGPAVEDEGWYDVVGVVSDTRGAGQREAPPAFYVPMEIQAWQSMDLIVRTDLDAASLAPGLRDLIRRLDPGLPIGTVRTVESLGQEALSRPRFYTGLFGGFAAVALLLAVVGVYGTTAYSTRARVREIGIRMALGARRGRVVGGVVGQAGSVVMAGILGGLAGAAAASRWMVDSLTYVTPRDAPTYALVAVVVLIAGLVAAWLPARAAGRIDPAQTLQSD